jgi:hypothetical protein
MENFQSAIRRKSGTPRKSKVDGRAKEREVEGGGRMKGKERKIREDRENRGK